MKSSLSQFQGCIIGQCLGDALGFPVEGHPPEICQDYVEKYLNVPPDKMLGCAQFPFGQYTDDSQLARELIQSYTANNGKFHPELYAKRIAAIFAENRIVGRGLATEKAAFKLIEGVPWTESGVPAPSAGNGTAMRAAPIGLFFFDDTDKLIQGAIDQGRITHTDPRCHAGAVAIALAVALVLCEKELDPTSFLSTLIKYIQPIDQTMTQGLQNLNTWIELSPKEAVKEISPFGLDPGYRKEYSWRNISPFVVPSVLWSLYSFLKTPGEYMDAIKTSIIVGGDVDTTAAMVGAISGAYLGMEAIPEYLAKEITDQGTWNYWDILELLDETYKIKFS
ncbi:MAG: ADP-ribosylglycohydrolase family protein [Candidatus Hodarchaeales archaeon]